MTPTPVWRDIATTLTEEISAGHYRPGDKLPTEAQLAARFGVNRHTIRRALSDLSEQGFTHARRGSGVFVLAEPTDYPLGKRVRFHQNLSDAGRMPTKRILAIQTRPSDADEAEALQISPRETVHVYEGLSLSDDVPVALFRSVFPAERLPKMDEYLQRFKSVTKALQAAGVSDYTRASTRLTAKTASATQALQLSISEGAPILRTVGINVDTHGTPVEFGHTWFVGDRITLLVDDQTQKST